MQGLFGTRGVPVQNVDRKPEKVQNHLPRRQQQREDCTADQQTAEVASSDSWQELEVCQ